MRIPVDGRSTRRMSRVQIPSAPPLSIAQSAQTLGCGNDFDVGMKKFPP